MARKTGAISGKSRDRLCRTGHRWIRAVLHLPGKRAGVSVSARLSHASSGAFKHRAGSSGHCAAERNAVVARGVDLSAVLESSQALVPGAAGGSVSDFHGPGDAGLWRTLRGGFDGSDSAGADGAMRGPRIQKQMAMGRGDEIGRSYDGLAGGVPDAGG